MNPASQEQETPGSRACPGWSSRSLVGKDGLDAGDLVPIASKLRARRWLRSNKPDAFA